MLSLPSHLKLIRLSSSSAPVKPFSLPAFLHHLKALAPNPLQFRSKGLVSKGKVETEFYTTFCTAGCFMTWYQNHMSSVQAKRGFATGGTWPFLNWSPSRIAEESRTSESGDSNRESRSSCTADSHYVTPRSSVSSVPQSPAVDGHAAGRRANNGAFCTLSPQRRL